jgi:predicted PurR-regulated permease PerM
MSEPIAPPAAAVPVSTAWGVPLRLFALGLVFIILFTFVWLLAPVANIILFGFVFAFIFHAAARFAQRYLGDNYGFATILVYVLVALVLFTVIGAVALAVFREARTMVHDVGEAATAIQAGTTTAPGLPPQVVSLLNDLGYTSTAQATMSIVGRFFAQVSLNLSSVIGMVATVAISLLFAFMLQWGVYSNRKRALGWVPSGHQRDSLLLLRNFDSAWAGYLVAGIIFAAVLSLISFVQYVLMSVPFPIVLALATGFITLIPSVGGILSTVLVFVVCVALGPTSPTTMDNLTYAVIVAIVNGIITQATYYFVGLPITGRGVRLPIAIVLIGSMAGLATGSLIFAWLTVPIIASLRTGLGYLLAKANGLDPFPGETLPDEPPHGFLSQLIGPKSPQ